MNSPPPAPVSRSLSRGVPGCSPLATCRGVHAEGPPRLPGRVGRRGSPAAPSSQPRCWRAMSPRPPAVPSTPSVRARATWPAALFRGSCTRRILRPSPPACGRHTARWPSGRPSHQTRSAARRSCSPTGCPATGAADLITRRGLDLIKAEAKVGKTRFRNLQQASAAPSAQQATLRELATGDIRFYRLEVAARAVLTRLARDSR